MRGKEGETCRLCVKELFSIGETTLRRVSFSSPFSRSSPRPSTSLRSRSPGVVPFNSRANEPRDYKVGDAPFLSLDADACASFKLAAGAEGGKKRGKHGENTRARRNCVKALLGKKKLGQKICPRLESTRTFPRLFCVYPTISLLPLFLFLLLYPSSSRSATPLARFLLQRGRLFTPRRRDFFQSRRCNDFNLKARSQHTRRPPPTTAKQLSRVAIRANAHHRPAIQGKSYRRTLCILHSLYSTCRNPSDR